MIYQTIEPPARPTAVAKLEALAAGLARRGFATTVATNGRYPRVCVVSRQSGMLTEDIYAAPADGALWFWWSWAERIVPIDDVDAAADKIAYVLTP